MPAQMFADKFVREFTFDTRYEVKIDEIEEPPPTPMLSCFVSNGGVDAPFGIYAYEVLRLRAYNKPRAGGLNVPLIEHWSDESEEWAITSLAYRLLAEASLRHDNATRERWE